MPTYEFRCPNGHEFERFYRKMSDAEGEVVPCPECGAVGERQLSAGAGLLFKGSGFYLTDYGKNAHRKAGPAGTAKSGEGKGEGAAAGGDAKSGDPKSGDAKLGDTKSGDTKSGDAKPAAAGESKSKAEKPPPPKSGGDGGGEKS
ncbi:MAG: zinc ribbon domain-containing protein [Gemmatimonadota bacterium]|nr:zinc ribbon domain-containing protein [Gemmatimonadota bacterium]